MSYWDFLTMFSAKFRHCYALRRWELQRVSTSHGVGEKVENTNRHGDEVVFEYMKDTTFPNTFFNSIVVIKVSAFISVNKKKIIPFWISLRFHLTLLRTTFFITTTHLHFVYMDPSACLSVCLSVRPSICSPPYLRQT